MLQVLCVKMLCVTPFTYIVLYGITDCNKSDTSKHMERGCHDETSHFTAFKKKNNHHLKFILSQNRNIQGSFKLKIRNKFRGKSADFAADILQNLYCN